MAKLDTYQAVTDAIIAQLDTGTRPWQPRWLATGGAFHLPRRANNIAYRGINILLLWVSAQERGFGAAHWMTFKQAQALGGTVRKGEKGTHIVFFKTLDRTETNAAGEEVDRTIPMLKSYTVFNADQVDGLPDHYRPAPLPMLPDRDRDEATEAALRSCGAHIREGGTEAFYVPSQDYVQMPDHARFHAASGYAATLAHELCHWTGHKSRLDRDQKNRFGSKDYAFEELVALSGQSAPSATLQ